MISAEACVCSYLKERLGAVLSGAVETKVITHSTCPIKGSPKRNNESFHIDELYFENNVRNITAISSLSAEKLKFLF